MNNKQVYTLALILIPATSSQRACAQKLLRELRDRAADETGQTLEEMQNECEALALHIRHDLPASNREQGRELVEISKLLR
jgi:hypothetical protein